MSTLTRRLVSILNAVCLCILIAVAVSILYWCFFLFLDGKSLKDALAGKLEDGLSTLQGLVTLGGLVGFGVGLLYGLGRIGSRESA